MKLTVNEPYLESNGTEITEIAKLNGAMWDARLVDGRTVALFSHEILVSA